jgi:hypothetical protein
MQSPQHQSRQLQLALKIVAIVCGALLLVAATKSVNPFLDLAAFIQFATSQLQSTSQLQWFFGIIFLSAGIFFVPVKANKKKTFVGEKVLSNDAYVLYLVDHYQIEKNLVLDQHIACNKIFPSIQDALAYVHLIECDLKVTAPVGNNVTSSEAINIAEENPSQPTDSVEAEDNVLKNPFLNIQSAPEQMMAESWDEARRKKAIGIFGTALFVIVLGGLYYANSNSVQNVPKPVEVATSVTPPTETSNTDQVVSGSIPVQETTGASDAKEALKPLTPINERWIGTWNAEGAKLKLTVTSNLLKFNEEEFTWTGTRPKGVVQCCLAFYEGATNKSDLLARISGYQEPGVTLKPEAQKTLALVNGLSDGNFKRIVLADPYLKKYFFIYDQNHIYRISRDLGDKVDVVVEQFKKQE